MAPRRAEELRTCERILPAVSRTFALTIRVLPDPLRRPVTVAYLLCRLADILEDASADDPRERVLGLRTLAQILARIDAPAEEIAGSLEPAAAFALDDDSALLWRERLAVARAFSALPVEQRQVIALWVRAMCSGMAEHVTREVPSPARVAVGTDAVELEAAVPPPARRTASSGRTEASGPSFPATLAWQRVPFVLETMEDLRGYAWVVAGTVGHLLTGLFLLHFGEAALPPERLRALAGHFGTGLQFTNILQDLAEDRVRGWSYLPEELARRHGTSVQRLDDPSRRREALRVVGDLVGETAHRLDHALEYTLLLPRRAPRVRLFCLWPTFFALRTLVRIWGEENVLTGGEKVRISRAEVRRVVRETTAVCLSNTATRALYRRERGRLERRMAECPL